MTGPRFRIGKCWQIGNEQVIWQLNSVTRVDPAVPRKCYLSANLTEKSFGIVFQATKPEPVQSQSAFPSLVRKHLTGSFLGDILHTANGDLQIKVIRAPDVNWLCVLRASHPPELNLIDHNDTILARTGIKGTYTKRKTIDFDLLDGISVFQSLWDRFSNAEPNQDTHSIQQDARTSQQKRLIKQIRRRLKTLRQTLIRAQSKLPSPEYAQTIEQDTALLATYLHCVEDGADYLQLEEHDNIRIELDSTLSPGENLNARYLKIKKIKKSLDLGNKYCQRVQEDMERLHQTIESLNSKVFNDDDIQKLSSELRLKAPSTGTGKIDKSEKARFRTFYSSDKQVILIGKNAEDNDRLTKQARGNDLWFHVAGMTGSHVIIPTSKPTTTPRTERQAAILAIHYSPLRKDLCGEVYRTQRRHLRKRKGLPPGLWLIDQSTTQFIKYTQEELDEVLQSTI